MLFGWVLRRRKVSVSSRILGTVITVFVLALALHAVSPPFDKKDAEGNITKTGKIQLGLDLKGGTSFLIRLVAEPDEKGEKKEITKTMVDQAVEVIRKRVDKMGTSEPIITPSGTDRILVQIPGLSAEKLNGDARAAPAGRQARIPDGPSEQRRRSSPARRRRTPPTRSRPTRTNATANHFTEQILVKKKTDIRRQHGHGRRCLFDTQGWGVSLQFNSAGAELFGQLTARKRRQTLRHRARRRRSSRAPVIRDAIWGGQRLDHRQLQGTAGAQSRQRAGKPARRRQ